MSVSEALRPWAAELDAARREQGIPVALLCRRAQVSRRYWYLILSGQRVPSPDVLRRLAGALPVLDPDNLVATVHPDH